MIEKLNEAIINLLKDSSTFVKSCRLAHELGVNERTVRRRVQQINHSGFKKIGLIESKRGQGFRLLIYNKEKFGEFFDYTIAETSMNAATNRRAAIFEYLVDHQYVTKQNLEETFYISETTLNNDISMLNYYGKDTKVKVEVDRQKGLCISGMEYYVRNMVLKLIYDSGGVNVRRRESRKFKTIWTKTIQDVLCEERIYINKHTEDAIINYLSASRRNILKGRGMSAADIENCFIEQGLILNLAKRICEEISKVLEITFVEEEVYFFSFFLRSILPLEIVEAKSCESEFKQAKEIVKELVDKINTLGLPKVSKRCIEDMTRFWYGLLLRIRLDIQKREMNFLNIEVTYAQAYFISKVLFNEIEKMTGFKFSREEVAYFSLIIDNHYFLENSEKKKILALLPSDYTISRVYVSEMKHFSKYTVDIMDYDSFLSKKRDMIKYDLVINPFEHQLDLKGVVVYRIKDIIRRDDFSAISRILTYKNYDALIQNLKICTEAGKRYSAEYRGTEYLGSSIGFVVDGTVKSMELGSEDREGIKRYYFLINATLSSDEILDLLKVAVETIIKLNSSRVWMNKEKIIEYYSK